MVPQVEEKKKKTKGHIGQKWAMGMNFQKGMQNKMCMPSNLYLESYNFVSV